MRRSAAGSALRQRRAARERASSSCPAGTRGVFADRARRQSSSFSRSEQCSCCISQDSAQVGGKDCEGGQPAAPIVASVRFQLMVREWSATGSIRSSSQRLSTGCDRLLLFSTAPAPLGRSARTSISRCSSCSHSSSERQAAARATPEPRSSGMPGRIDLDSRFKSRLRPQSRSLGPTTPHPCGRASRPLAPVRTRNISCQGPR